MAPSFQRKGLSKGLLLAALPRGRQGQVGSCQMENSSDVWDLGQPRSMGQSRSGDRPDLAFPKQAGAAEEEPH